MTIERKANCDRCPISGLCSASKVLGRNFDLTTVEKNCPLAKLIASVDKDPILEEIQE